MSSCISASFKIDGSLSITELRQSDKVSLIEQINSPDISQNSLHIPFPYIEKDADDFLQLCRDFEETFGHIAHFAIRWDGDLVGGIGFLYVYGEDSHIAEIGYWIGKAHRNKGIATAAIKKIIEIGFSEKGLSRLEANIFLGNKSSVRAIEKAGFELEGLRRSRFIKNGKLKDAYLYAIVSIADGLDASLDP